MADEREYTPQQIAIIIRKKAEKAAKEKQYVGKVYRGETKYIDREPKKERNYVVVRETPRGVSVAKLKTIKKFDDKGKNADRALVEINHERYGLSKRTGVDSQTYSQNLMSKQPLNIKDSNVFPEKKERFKLGSSDLYNVLRHTGKNKKPKKKK